MARLRHRERRLRARPSLGQRRKQSGSWTTAPNSPSTDARRRGIQPISRPPPTATGKAQGLPTEMLLTGMLLTGVLLTEVLGTVIAGRIRTQLVHRAGAASAPETTARPPDMATAGRSRTSTETRTGAATGMKTMAAARTVASSAELPREDDRVIGVGPRHEGPLPIFPSLFGW